MFCCGCYLKFWNLRIILCSLSHYPIDIHISPITLEVLQTGLKNAMTLNYFIELDEMKQLEIFWSGEFVGELSDGEFRMVCHQVGDFYIEYKILGGHYLGMKTFKNPDLLEPYLGQIDISGLIF